MLRSILFAVVPILLFFGANSYLCRRIYPCLQPLLPGLSAQGFGLVCLLSLTAGILSLMRSRLRLNPKLKRALAVFGGYWLGLFLYLLLLFSLSDALLLLLQLAKLIPAANVLALRRILGAAVMLLSVAIVLGGSLRAKRLVHRSYQVETAKKLHGKPWKIVLISDIHLGAVGSEQRLERLVEEINGETPDIICMAGDLFDNDFSAILDPERCAAALRQLRAPGGVYACLGNHDTGATLPEMLDFLTRCGIRLLDEKSVLVDEALVVAGRLDASPIGGYGERKRGNFASVTADCDRTKPVIVLDHTPSHTEEYPSWVDLVLCGHTHQGQLFPGGLFTKRLFVVDYGQYRRDESSPTFIVSSGAGTWGPPLRTGSDCEIVTITLREKG